MQCFRFLLAELARTAAEDSPDIGLLVERARAEGVPLEVLAVPPGQPSLPPAQLTRIVDDLRMWRGPEELRRAQKSLGLLLDPDSFEHVCELVGRLPPLKRQRAARRHGKDAAMVSAGRAEDHTRVYDSLSEAINLREQRKATFNSNWCRDRDRAIVAASKALLKLRDVYIQSTLAPGLMLRSFSGVEREFSRHLMDALPSAPVEAYEGQGWLVQRLLAESPSSLGWVGRGRPPAAWLDLARAELQEQGVRGENLEGLVDAAGLHGSSPERPLAPGTDSGPLRGGKPKR